MKSEQYEVVTIMGHNGGKEVSAFRRGGLTTFMEAVETAQEIILGMGSYVAEASFAIYRDNRLIKFYEKRLINIILKEKKK